MFYYMYLYVLYIYKSTLSSYLMVHIDANLCVSFYILPSFSSNTGFDPEIDSHLYSQPI